MPLFFFYFKLVEQERKILEQGKLLNDYGKRLIQLEHKVGVLKQYLILKISPIQLLML